MCHKNNQRIFYINKVISFEHFQYWLVTIFSITIIVATIRFQLYLLNALTYVRSKKKSKNNEAILCMMQCVKNITQTQTLVIAHAM